MGLWSQGLERERGREFLFLEIEREREREREREIFWGPRARFCLLLLPSVMVIRDLTDKIKGRD